MLCIVKPGWQHATCYINLEHALTFSGNKTKGEIFGDKHK